MGILIKPIVTEKLTVQGEKLNRYGFIVDREANKLQIKAAVEQAYNVTVADVNTVNYMVRERLAILRQVCSKVAQITIRKLM